MNPLINPFLKEGQRFIKKKQHGALINLFIYDFSLGPKINGQVASSNKKKFEWV